MKRSLLLLVFVLGSIAVCAFSAFPLSIGDKAPDFALTTTSDSSVSLAQNQDQVRVIYFLCLG